MRLFLALALALIASAASAASTVWTCTVQAKGQLGAVGYVAFGSCLSDTGTCDTSQTAFTAAQICGNSSLVIRRVIIAGGAPDGGGSGLLLSYDHTNNKIVCNGSNGAGPALLANNTATAMTTLTSFSYFALCQ